MHPDCQQTGCLQLPVCVDGECGREGRDYVDERQYRDDPERTMRALCGLVGLVQLLAHNSDIPLHVREGMVCNHRYLEALRVVEPTELGTLLRRPG